MERCFLKLFQHTGWCKAGRNIKPCAATIYIYIYLYNYIYIYSFTPAAHVACRFRSEISNRVAAITGDSRASSFLFLIIMVSISIQRFNQIAFRGTVKDAVCSYQQIL